MKKIFLLLALSTLVTAIFFSCKKDKSCEGCKGNNNPPTAIAGLDQVITLPTESISLDGSSRVSLGIHTRHVCEVGRTQGKRSHRIF